MIGSLRSTATATELPSLIIAAALATFGAIALLGLQKPLLLLAAPVAGMGLVFAARRPLMAVLIMVVVEVTNVSGVLEPRTSIPFFPASLLLGVLAVGFAFRDPRARERINAWTVICAGFLLVFLATQAVATVGSVDVAVSVASLRRTILDCVFVMLVLILIQLTERPWLIAGAVVVPIAILSSLTLVNELVFDGSMPFGGFATVALHSGAVTHFATHRYGGPLPDSNFWGRHLVMGLPLAATMLTRALRSGRRSAVALWLPTVPIILAGVFLTQSRGTFLAAGTAVFVWFLASERSVRRRGLAIAPLALLIFAVPGIGNRLVSAGQDLMQAEVNSNIDPSVLNRLAAQQEAWLMFEQRPVFGFGPGTFPNQVIEFAGRVPIAARNPTDAPHNLYAEFASASGIFGLFGLAVLILGFLTVAVLRMVAEPRSSDRLLAVGVCAAIVAWSAASIGLHLAFFRTFGVVLALAGGLAPAWPLPVEVIRRFVRGLTVWLAAAIIGVGAFSLIMAANSTPAVTATQRMTLIPVGPVDGYYSYALDIRSRAEFLPTFAILMADPGSPVSIAADPVRGVLTFTATADTTESARDELQLAVARADSAMHTSIGYQQYSLQTVGSMQLEPSEKRSTLVSFVAGGAGVCTALMSALVLSRLVARRRVDKPLISTSLRVR